MVKHFIYNDLLKLNLIYLTKENILLELYIKIRCILLWRKILDAQLTFD